MTTSIDLTIKHYFRFDEPVLEIADGLDAKAWDALRETTGPFGLPSDRTTWARLANSPEPRARAQDTLRLARRLGTPRLCSYGVGAAVLELNLIQLAPDLELSCTEYSPRTRQRLGNLFPEARVLQHDLLSDSPLDGDLHIFNRIDTEFTNEQLEDVLVRFPVPILLIPTELLGLRILVREALTRTRRRAVAAGYVRTRAAFESLIRTTHTWRPALIGHQDSYLLVPHDKNDVSDRNAIGRR